MKHSNDLHVRVDASPFFYWLTIAFVGVIAAGSLVAFFDRMSYARAGDYGLLAFGLFLAFITFRMVSHFLFPVVSVTANQFVVRRFWPPSSYWLYADLERFEVEVRKIELRNWAQGGAKVTGVAYVEELFAIGNDGRRRKTLLPAYANENEELLATLAERSGLPVIRVEHDEGSA